jgi:hypothetical protein
MAKFAIFALMFTWLVTQAEASPSDCPEIQGAWTRCIARTVSGEMIPFPGTKHKFVVSKKAGAVQKIVWTQSEANTDDVVLELIPDGIEHAGQESGANVKVSCEAKTLIINFSYQPLNFKSTQVFTRDGDQLVMKDPSLSDTEPMEICIQ